LTRDATTLRQPSVGAVQQRKRRPERGQALVELAVVVPIFFILVFGIVDFSLGLKAWIAITNSAREGARYAAVTCATDSYNVTSVKNRAVATSGNLLTVADVTVTNCPGDSSESVVVTTEYDYDLVTPLGGLMSIFGGGMPNTISISSSSNMRLE
jgi:Flp pilus assembly protein TadG